MTSNGSHPVVNGDRASSSALRIIIVGAGIGGLSAASFLKRQRHYVEVYESSKFAKELGAAIHIPPNAHSLLEKIGVDPAKIGANPCTRLSMYTSGGHKINSIDTSVGAKMWTHPWLLGHRVKLHDTLNEAAVAAGATLHLNKSAVRIDEEQGIVEFDDGTTVHGDVIIGADGVHSICRTRVSPQSKPFSSGKSAFRFLIPRQIVLDDPQTRPYAGTDGEMVMVYHADRRLVMYPTSDNSILNFVCIHPEVETESSATGNWNNNATKEMLLDVFRDFHEDFRAILQKSDEDSLKIWKLLDMAPLESWSSGKLALMGDAAHPFLPHQGQGGAVAIEDAAALGVFLEAGLKAENVPERLRLYESVRKPRANKLQEYTRLAGEDLKPGQASKLDVRDYTNYNFGHDEFDHSSQKLREWKWSQQSCRWRMPMAFGPMPGPRQDFEGHPRNGQLARFVSTSIKIKTSRTVLQSLLPIGKGWSFASPATVATCSFTQMTYSNLDWLAGGGYSWLGLYIDGVVCPGGKGVYLPVLFENLADPIVSGREELGMPKVYSEIDVKRNGSSSTIKASWRGHEWCAVEVDDLEEGVVKSEGGGEGLIFQRHIPAVGAKGVDADYPVFVPFKDATTKPKVERVWRGSSAKIAFDAGDWHRLPTLHHIVERLAEIPVYQVLETKVEEGTGVDDVAAAIRI